VCIQLEERYVKFFDLLPKTAQLSLRMLVPNKYEKLDTEILSCVCIQQGILKKTVIDNLKETADRVVNNIAKQDSSCKKEIKEFSDLEITDEFAEFLDNYLFFTSVYGDKLNSNLITYYVTYLLVSNKHLKSHTFFDAHLYVKYKSKVESELMQVILSSIGIVLSEELIKYGDYITNPLMLNQYPCFGRDTEVKQCVDTLCRFKKSNVILVGQPGVGKTSIVYGLCNYLQSPHCPKQLKGKSIFSLNVNRLISGTTYRGDLEKRISDVIKELESNRNIILFIDEIHTLFNKPTGDDTSASIQNVFKPYLAENSMVVGCTTEKEYKIIESDRAFERRFQKIQVKETGVEQTVKIIMSVKDKYEKFHGVSIPDSICNYIVNQCDTRIRNKFFPDKAFDILDKSCVMCKNKEVDISTDIIDNSISDYMNINGSDSVDVESIRSRIKSKILGQDEAVDTVFRYIQKYLFGIVSDKKPLGSFLFVGPTGVGKTELCRQLASELFSPESFIRLDMSEFMEAHSVSKLIGSPPGYVGFYSGGSLTEKVKNNAHAVILVDEVEKAHKDVLNIFLQIMDDGRLTDSSGTTIDFRNTFIIMTSNIGCKEYLEHKNIGFNSVSEDTDILKKSVEQYFSPEFLNRLDEVIYFNSITEESCKDITNIIIDNRITMYDKKMSLGISVSDKARIRIAEMSYNKKYGARYTERKVNDILDDVILFNNNECFILDKNNDIWSVEVKDEK